MIRYAVIGRNFVVDWMIEAARLIPSLKLVGVCSRREETARLYAAKQGAEKIYTDVEALAADPSIDMVYIASPNACHTQQAVVLLRAGKHVLCEKPIAPTLADFYRMRAAAEEGGALLMEAMVPVHTPAFSRMRQLMEQIAPIRRISLQYCQYSSRYDRFKQGIVENAFDPTLCGGALMDIGIYPVQVACMLLGRPTLIGASATELPGSIDGEGAMLLRFPNGIGGDIRYSKITDSVLPSEIMGEGGCLRVDRISRPSCLTLLPRHAPAEEIQTEEGYPAMYYELRDFVAQIETGHANPCWLAGSEEALRLTDAVRLTCGISFTKKENSKTCENVRS